MVEHNYGDTTVVTEMQTPTTAFITLKAGKTACVRFLASTNSTTLRWLQFNALSARQALFIEHEFLHRFQRTRTLPGRTHPRHVAEAGEVSRTRPLWPSAASSPKLTKGIHGRFTANNQVSTSFHLYSSLEFFESWWSVGKGRSTIQQQQSWSLLPLDPNSISN